MSKRFFLQIPFPYLFLLSAMALLLAYVLLKIDLPLTWQSVAGMAVIQLFFCSRIQYTQNKRLFLKQYRGMLPLSVLLDSFLLSIPFALVSGYAWATALVVAILYSTLGVSGRRGIKIRPVLPSPFFMKSSYLWHAGQRYVLPVIWLLIALLIVMAGIHENYNLGMVALLGGTLLASSVVIMETEAVDFVRMYLTPKHFTVRTLLETLYNTSLYLLPLSVTMVLFFPAQWAGTLLCFPAVLLVNVQLLWTKYAFYPSTPLAAVIFLFGLLLQGALSITIYGIVIIPVYTVILYFLLQKKLREIIPANEIRVESVPVKEPGGRLSAIQ